MTKSEYNKRDPLSEAKYEVGDQVKVEGILCRILEVDYLQWSNKYIYLVKFDGLPILNRIIVEGDIDEWI